MLIQISRYRVIYSIMSVLTIKYPLAIILMLMEMCNHRLIVNCYAARWWECSGILWMYVRGTSFLMLGSALIYWPETLQNTCRTVNLQANLWDWYSFDKKKGWNRCRTAAEHVFSRRNRRNRDWDETVGEIHAETPAEQAIGPAAEFSANCGNAAEHLQNTCSASRKDGINSKNLVNEWKAGKTPAEHLFYLLKREIVIFCSWFTEISLNSSQKCYLEIKLKLLRNLQ